MNFDSPNVPQHRANKTLQVGDPVGGIVNATRHPPLIVGIGGSIRANSSSERAVRVCLAAAEANGARTVLIAGRGLDLPLYDPGSSARMPEAGALVEAFRACDGLIIGSPAYHGTMSGLIKNALDYAEDLRSDPRVYFDSIAVGCIASGAGWQASVQTLACLRTVVHCLRGWPTPFGVALNSTEPLFDVAGNCTDPNTRTQLELVAKQVCEFAQLRATNSQS